MDANNVYRIALARHLSTESYMQTRVENMPHQSSSLFLRCFVFSELYDFVAVAAKKHRTLMSSRSFALKWIWLDFQSPFCTFQSVLVRAIQHLFPKLPVHSEAMQRRGTGNWGRWDGCAGRRNLIRNARALWQAVILHSRSPPRTIWSYNVSIGSLRV